MTTKHASRLTLSLIAILCLEAQCSFGDNEVGRVKDDGGLLTSDGFVADSASDAHPAADMISVSDDTAGPDVADARTASDSVDAGPATDVQPDVRATTDVQPDVGLAADGAGPNTADSSPTSGTDTAGSTCGEMSFHPGWNLPRPGF